MASQRIKDHIRAKMKGWDGNDPDVLKFMPQHGIDRGWATDWYEWGRRVRRDILVLEKLLVEKGTIDKADLYGDPGDPPPPPSEI